MNKYVVMGAIGLGAAGLYLFMRSKFENGNMPVTYNPQVNGPNNNQATAAVYPYSNVGGAGATQSNQPWSNGPLRPNVSTPLDVNLTNLNMIASGLSSISSIVDSSSELWGSINSWFGDDTSNSMDFLNWGDSGDMYA